MAEPRSAQLAEMRKRLGISQQLPAERMGISQARVSQIEHGQIGGLDILRPYVVALGGTRHHHPTGRKGRPRTGGHQVARRDSRRH
ncbi:helix-turn-helix domain-containing protein [Planobispora rosea]|uniref:helix-turn-helix domain-containing protein n=1 Tax=Planobispora rosea TaxID=35762 RepID=UPI003570E426